MTYVHALVPRMAAGGMAGAVYRRLTEMDRPFGTLVPVLRTFNQVV